MTGVQTCALPICFPVTIFYGGSRFAPPKYYDKLMRRNGDVRMDAIEFARDQRARLSVADNTDERRAVREIVHRAKIQSLKRGDV